LIYQTLFNIRVQLKNSEIDKTRSFFLG